MPLRWLSAHALLLGACAPLQRPAPLHVRNQHPVQLTAIHAGARAARPTDAGSVDLGLSVDWTSLWLRPGTGGDLIELDGELVRTQVSARVGLGNHLDVELQVPFIYASGGTLDAFLETWHDIFGLPQSGRDQSPRGQFNVIAQRAGGDVYQMEPNRVELGDIPIFLAWIPLRFESGISVGVRGGIEFPTGDEDRGYGNGGVDTTLGVLGEWDLDWLSFFAWASHAWVQESDRAEAAGLSYPGVDSVGGGLEWGLSSVLSALAVVEWEESVLGNLDDSHADRNQVLLWLGGRARFSDAFALELAVAEDLIRNVSSDVTFHLGLRLRL